MNDGLLDIAYNAIPTNYEELDLKVVPILTAQIYALMNPEHPLAKYEHLPIEMLDKQSVCLLDDKSRIKSLMVEKFEQAGITPNIVSYHEQISCMYHMVDFGGFIGFCNADPHNPGIFGNTALVARPFVEPISFEAGFITRKSKHLSKIARDLITFTKNSIDILE